jgi:hypothetical protein
LRFKSKVLLGSLTDLSACVKPTQAHKSVKDPGNIFDINPKWTRTLPSLIYFAVNLTSLKKYIFS